MNQGGGVLDQRVAQAEKRLDEMSRDISDLEQQVTEIRHKLEAVQKQADKTDENQRRMWERLDEHRDGLVRTQTMVEGIGKSVDDIRVQTSSINEKLTSSQLAISDSKTDSSRKWEEFFGKVVWLVAGALVAAVAAKLK